MKVFLSSASFLKSYGGPAYSVRALAEALARNGANVAIWAPDGSARGQTRHADGTNWPKVIELVGPLKQAIQLFGEPDLFHDSGLWWRHNWQIAMLSAATSKPLIISTRGMLEPAAISHRAWKKRVAWQLYQRRILDRAAALHVTSDLEAKNVQAFELRAKTITIPNGLAVPVDLPANSRKRAKKIVFLGRLHPIKGLPMLIEAWGRIRPSDWTLEIAGPDEDGHRRQLELQARTLGLIESVQFSGPVEGDEKRQLLERASVFVLPSYSENFGIAAGEALGAGLPVIATKGTPWAALERERCGWHVCASVEGLETGLRAMLSASPEELVAMGQRGHAFVAQTYSWSRVADDMMQLYQLVLTRT